MELTFRCYTCKIFRAITVLQYLQKLYTKRNILRLQNTVKDPISLDDFFVLSTCSSSFELLLRESLLISKLKPSLNANLTSVPLTLYN